VGCGDWSFSRSIEWGMATYVGIDVVPNVVARLNRDHATDRVLFIHGDATRMTVPAADLLVVKDVLQHWPNQKILDFLGGLRRFRYVLLTNDRPRLYRRTGWRVFSRWAEIDTANADVPVGGYRPVRLREEPFRLDATCLLEFGVLLGKTIRHTKEVLLWSNRAAPSDHPVEDHASRYHTRKRRLRGRRCLQE
jgi:hypothetical protein